MTISEAHGYGRQRGHTEIYRGAENAVDLLPKVRLEILVNEQSSDQISDVLISTANIGNAVDGEICETHVGEAARVRAGERAKAAV